MRKLGLAIKDFLFGVTVYGMLRDVETKRLWTDYMTMFFLVGDMLGYPISSYYRLRLLPYIVARIERWKEVLLREIDII